MADSISYDTAKLVQVVPNLKISQRFLLNTFFPGFVTADTEEVLIDVDIGIRRMSPFVSPLVEGKLVEQRRYQTNKFKPAYIKDKRAPDLRKPVRRMIGEQVGGSMKPVERMLANLQFEMEDQVDMVNRRLEWMASQALQSAGYLVQGEGFEPRYVDFGRDPSLTIALTGNGRWGVPANFDASGRDPIPGASLDSWQSLMLKASGGVATDIVFTTSPWNAFKNSEGVQGATFYPVLSPSGNQINPGSQIARGAVLKGVWGQYNLWLYNDWFVDDNGVQQPMLPDGYVILSGADLMGTQAFGLIMDPKFAYEPMPYAPKTWISDDPAQQYLMMQSAPLVIPSRVNASLAAKVM